MKTRSSSISGGPEKAVLMLKTWAVWGQDVDLKSNHTKVWDRIVIAWKGGDLPCNDWLEHHKLDRWPERPDPSLVSTGKRRRKNARNDLPAPISDLLGGACPGISAEVHAYAVRLANDGALPITKPSQRLRRLHTKGSHYFTPVFLKPALLAGYISPSLPAPNAFFWVSLQGGSWYFFFEKETRA